MTDTAVTLLSGGIDSATCLGVACNTHDRIIPVHYQYGQQTAEVLNLSKPDVLERAEEVGVAFEHTYSCYANTPVEDPQPCGDCPACLERAEAFGKSSVEDPFHTKQVVADD